MGEYSDAASQASKEADQTVIIAQSSASGQGPAASSVSNVNFHDAPVVDFGEVARSNPAPRTSDLKDGNSVPVDSKLAEKLANLKGTSKYPLRTLLRTGRKWDAVITNDFQMTVDPNATFYEYRIRGIPASESRAGKKRYMETTIQNVPFLSQNSGSFATDNASTIISWVDLHEHAPGVQVVANNPVTGTGGEWRLVDIIDRNTTAHLNFYYSRKIDIAGLQPYAETTNTDPTAYHASPAENALKNIMARCITNSNTLHLNNHKFYVGDAF